MKLLPQPVGQEKIEFHYISYKSVANVRRDIEKLFYLNSSWLFGQNCITGKFSSATQFTFWRNHGSRKWPILKGSMDTNEDGVTLVTITVQDAAEPTYITYFLLPLISLVGVILAFAKEEGYWFKVVACTLPFITFAFSVWYNSRPHSVDKYRIKLAKEFAERIDLKKNEESPK